MNLFSRILTTFCDTDWYIQLDNMQRSTGDILAAHSPALWDTSVLFFSLIYHPSVHVLKLVKLLPAEIHIRSEIEQKHEWNSAEKLIDVNVRQTCAREHKSQ